LETFFLLEEKRSMRTRNFHRKNIFHDLFGGPVLAGRVAWFGVPETWQPGCRRPRGLASAARLLSDDVAHDVHFRDHAEDDQGDEDDREHQQRGAPVPDAYSGDDEDDHGDRLVVLWLWGLNRHVRSWQ
jgi:hypothetical protein